MSKEIWRIWNKDESVEQRTFLRTTGELPEMECTKQLVNLISGIYEPDMKVLDVGCASGHYYNGVKRLDDNINYHGIDATVPYIEFAKKHFENNPNTSFELGDIFNLDEKHTKQFDVVYCCNVLLHLPDFREPIKNLLKVTKDTCFIRTLIGPNTHLSKYLYSDKFDENGEPTDFVFQNTYSHDLFKSYIESQGDFEVEFIKDEFDVAAINKEYTAFNEAQGAVTLVQNNVQIAGSKVFEWEWVKITRK
jgi:SAM-dependent methyltransferase